jgi:hypothetical protein
MGKWTFHVQCLSANVMPSQVSRKMGSLDFDKAWTSRNLRDSHAAKSAVNFHRAIAFLLQGFVSAQVWTQTTANYFRGISLFPDFKTNLQPVNCASRCTVQKVPTFKHQASKKLQ